MSPSGKAPDFDSGTRWFKSGHPSQQIRVGKSLPLFAGWDPSLPSICARANASVHIRRSEIGELAHQAQSERIFARKREYPAGEYKPSA